MSEIFKKTSERLKFQNLNIKKKDLNRPWGGFFDIDEDDFMKFIDLYFKSDFFVQIIFSFLTFKYTIRNTAK